MKLRRFDLKELHVRAKQKLSALAERHGWSSLSRLPSAAVLRKDFQTAWVKPDELLNHFRSRSSPHFFSGFDNQQKIAEVLLRRFSETEAAVIERANRAIDGKFDLLGLAQVDFGVPIDWHLEPISGKRSPAVHWSRVKELDAAESGDKKIVWEINRHQHFVLLGEAYWLTNDERYAEAFVSQLSSWMDQNPPKLGINWISSLEIAFRSISWIWGLYFFRNSPHFSAAFFRRTLDFLYLNARHLEMYLSTYFSPNTHLTGEALGLFYLGTMFPEFKEADRWRATGRNILLEQLPIHVRSDGVYFEQSSYYHRYTTDFYTHFLLLSRLNDDFSPPDVSRTLQQLLDHLMYITRPDGTMPLFGDDDGGRLMMFGVEPGNVSRSSLATAAVLFQRGDYKFVAHQPYADMLWLLGVESLDQFDTLVASEPSKQSVAFRSGGYYVMRDAWTRNANYLLFDCGPHGVLNCGHAHSDALSFELAANGRTLLVDPGTFTYTGSPQLRDWFRSSAAHNTLTVDGQSSSVSEGPFSWRTVANVQCSCWLSRDRFDFVEGRHDGYRRLEPPVDHTRSVLFLKHDYWIVSDEIRSGGKHEVDLWFHFDSGTNPLIEAGHGSQVRLTERRDEDGLDLLVFGENGRWRREDAFVSHCYGKRESARLYAYRERTSNDRQLITFLLPAQKTGGNYSVREVEAIGGKALELKHENGLDIVMIRDRRAKRVEMERLASDCIWTWVRFADPESSLPEELVLIQGTSLTIEGAQVLKSRDHIDYLAGMRKGKQFLIDTDKANFNCGLQVADLSSSFVSLGPGE